MKIEAFLKDCTCKGIHLYLKDRELGYRAKKGVMTIEILATLKENKANIIKHLKLSDPSHLQFQISTTLKEKTRLSNRFLWKDYSSRIMEVTTANVTHSAIRKKGEFYEDALEKAISAILNRHEVLNCAIEKYEGDLYLVDRPKQAPAFSEIFVKGETPERREKKAMDIANELIWKEYNLEIDPLYRVFVIRLSTNDYIFGVGLHHAIGDMVSINILFQEIMALYYTVLSSTPPRLHPVKYRYMDYLASLATWANSPGGIENLNYWKDSLRSTPVTCLKPNPEKPESAVNNRQAAASGLKSIFNAKSTFSEEENYCVDVSEKGSNKCSSVSISSEGDSAEEIVDLDPEVTNDIKKLAARLKKTLFCIILAMYKIAVWKMTGQEDPVVISLQTGRPNNDLVNVIGDFAMEIAYKTDLSGNPDFEEITERVARTMSEAQSHQPIPLDWVRKELLDEGIQFIAPGMSILPANAGGADNQSIKHLRFPPPGVRHGCHGYSLSCAIEFRESPKAIVGSMIYRKDVYDELTIQKFLGYFKEAVIDAINNPGKKLNEFA